MRLLAVIAFGLAAQCAQAADPPLGRIFFSPEQRTQLDALRKQRSVASQVRDEPVPEVVTYNGIVRRSDGKTTVWLNNELLSESELLGKQSIVGSIGRNGQVTLQAPETAIRLKVGQSATLFTGKVEESFVTKKAPADKPKSNEHTDSKPAPTPDASTKDIPPELVEALRQAARARGQASPDVMPEQGSSTGSRPETPREMAPR